MAVVKLSLYLMAEGVRPDGGVLRRSPTLPLEELEPSSALPFPHVGYAVRNKPSAVSWAGYVRRYFDLGDVENVTNSFVMVFEAAGRTWALTYGQGFHAIDLTHVEPGFGMRVVANSIDPDAVRSADVRTSDVLSRLTRAQVSAGAGIRELGIAVDNEMVRHLAGRLLPGDAEGQWARAMSGADSLHIEVRWPLEELAERCELVLQRYHSDDYRANFGFIDNFQALRPDDSKVEELEDRLVQVVASRGRTKLSVASPDVIDFDNVDHYEIWRGRRRSQIDLSLDDIYEFLESLDDESSELDVIDKVQLVAVDLDGSLLAPQRPLHRYFAAEIELGDETFALVAGRWYHIDDNFVASINSAVQGIVDVTDELQLLPLERRRHDGKVAVETERDYNERVSKEPGWTLLDRRNVSHGGSYQRIEVADLARTAPATLVHVKKMTDSATLSHLWGQGSVSAELYQLDDGYRGKVLALCPGLPDEMSSILVVFAVATDRSGTVANELFFFSKVHLVQHLRTLRMIGCPVALAKIDVIDIE